MFKHFLDVDLITEELGHSGFIVIHDCISSEALAGLNGEFESAFEPAQDELVHGTDPAGRNARIPTSSLDTTKFPNIHQIFTSKEFTDIANTYRGWEQNCNDTIFFSHAYNPEPITGIHFDTYRAVKFLIYLTDTDSSTGAISFDRETHIENTRYRESFLKQGGELKNLLNIVPDANCRTLEAIAGRAGTVIIFDTDTFHKGGQVQLGKERRVIRSSSKFPGQPASMGHRFFSSVWWLSKVKSPALPANAAGRTSSRGTSRTFTRSKIYYAKLVLKKVINLASASFKK